jgi:hypothetical protein
MGRLIGQGRRFATLLGLAIACVATGCVERRYTIRTEPPGAYVVVNGEEIGPTPVSRSFVYHGDRDITLMLDGYQTQRIIQPMNAPWWDNLATEFFTENLIPYTFRDEQEYIYRMEPATVPATNDLVARGEALRSDSKVPPKPRRTGILGYFGF